MQPGILLLVGIVMGAAGCAAPSAAVATEVPEPIAAEHRHIHDKLAGVIDEGGETGKAAREVLALLAGHFEKEERLALPQLGALAQLAPMPSERDRPLDGAEQEDIIERTAALRAALPVMLEEHRAIRPALDKLVQAAKKEEKTGAAQLAHDIGEHAEMEELILYPAALLAGRQLEAARGER